MGWLDKIKTLGGLIGGGAATASNPITAVAAVVGGIANAVAAGEKLADNKQILAAGAAEGGMADVAKSQERVDAASAARADDGLRASTKQSGYRD